MNNSYSYVFLCFVSLLFVACANEPTNKYPERLKVSDTNPHLLETASGTPVFLNGFTIWKLIEHGTREDMQEIVTSCKKNKYNLLAIMLLGIAEWEGRGYETGVNPYGIHAFERGEHGIPDPLKPITTPGNDPERDGEYDYWDHVEYAIDLAAEHGMYVSLHPAWGNWFQGNVHGMKEGDITIFDEHTAYQYGNWLGQRFGDKDNVLWMMGGDRSAVNDKRTRWYESDTEQDFRALYRAMAEGLADGSNGIDQQDGQADYSNMVISYHPRKWGPNSSDWFHAEDWLTLNSVQDTPVDIVVAMENDYQLTPTKPTWLYEGRYEEAIHTWGVRYQAYHSVFAGGVGHVYGSDIWELADGWRELLDLPGNGQMAHLYTVTREIWSDDAYANRMPDQSLILGESGKIYGRGVYVVDDFESKKDVNHESSEYLSAIRCKNGSWAMVYTANGRPIELDLSKLASATLDAYWFNPRTGGWLSPDGIEKTTMDAHEQQILVGEGSRMFEAPGAAGADNDWILVLR